MKGKWAKGIAPRFFAWIIKDKLAVSERPGGYARNHRRVRRQEEILWLRGEGFTRVVSLLTSPHNLHAYDELDMSWAQAPFGPHDDPHVVLPDLYAQLRDWMAAGEQLLVHQEEVNDRLMGVVAGYLRWSGLVPDGPQAITVVERIIQRQMGPDGRELVAMTPNLAGAGGCGGPPTIRARMSEDQPARPREPTAPKTKARDPAVPSWADGEAPEPHTRAPDARDAAGAPDAAAPEAGAAPFGGDAGPGAAGPLPVDAFGPGGEPPASDPGAGGVGTPPAGGPVGGMQAAGATDGAIDATGETVPDGALEAAAEEGVPVGAIVPGATAGVAAGLGDTGGPAGGDGDLEPA